MKRNARLRCPFRKGTCEITQKTRRQCQACRLRKCLESGMRKESEWQGVPGRGWGWVHGHLEPGRSRSGPRGCVCAGVHTGTMQMCAHTQGPGQLVACEPWAGTWSGACSPSAGTTVPLGGRTGGGNLCPLLWVGGCLRPESCPSLPSGALVTLCPLYNCPCGILGKVGGVNLGEGSQRRQCDVTAASGA